MCASSAFMCAIMVDYVWVLSGCMKCARFKLKTSVWAATDATFPHSARWGKLSSSTLSLDKWKYFWSGSNERKLKLFLIHHICLCEIQNCTWHNSPSLLSVFVLGASLLSLPYACSLAISRRGLFYSFLLLFSSSNSKSDIFWSVYLASNFLVLSFPSGVMKTSQNCIFSAFHYVAKTCNEKLVTASSGRTLQCIKMLFYGFSGKHEQFSPM